MSSETSSKLIFYVNGKKVVEENAEPETTLLQYLRNKLRLPGTKLGCGEGGCGACTVMVSRFHGDKIQHFSVNACLAPVCSVHGMAVTTVEGIGSIKNGLHPVQDRLAKSHGSQCGFCTPGIIMSMYTLLRNMPQPTVQQVEKAFEGNLCRCTGYRPILDGFRTFTKEYCQMGEKCCRNNGTVPEENEVGTTLVDPSEFLPLDPSQDPIFPPELQINKGFDRESLTYTGERVVWYRPTSMQELLALKKANPDAKFVIGNTEIGVETKFKDMKYPVIIAPTHVPELVKISQSEDGITFGASVTLTRIDEELKGAIQEYPEYKTRIFSAVIEMLRWFAGYQIRNVAAVGGNIITASPISDLNPLFLAAGASLEVQNTAGSSRIITMDDKFFLGYRKTAIKADEILVSITIPFSNKDEYFYGYKQAYRREDDIATVNAGIRVQFEDNSDVIKTMSLAYGGMAPITVMATKTMAAVVGKKWDDSLVPEVCRLLADDLPLAAGSPGGMVEYRRTLTTSFFFKFYLTVQLQLQTMHITTKNRVPSSYKSATPTFHRDPYKSSQLYEEVASGQVSRDPVGRPMKHVAAMKQVTGEAIYVDDMPRVENELYLAFVYSQKAHALIVDVDSSEALQQTGVVDYVTWKDIPATNNWGPIPGFTEEIFATKEVLCYGQVIGAILADTQVHAQRAAKLVKVTYEELESIITIKDAIKAGSFFKYDQKMDYGDVEAAFQQADCVVEGECHVGGQEHFYLETHTSLVIPGEDGELEMYVSTQNPTETQLKVASCLNIPSSKVNCRVKRIGGGFGGKETRSISFTLPVAVAANKHGRAVRSMLDRDEDMIMSGTRHPFLGKYKAGFTSDGILLGLDIELYNNAGFSLDLSAAVMDRALFHCTNAYRVPNVRVKGFVCKTNTPSNTAFRGFGGPQGMMIAEHIMTDVALSLGVSPVQIREANLFQENDETHYRQTLEKCQVKHCWDECIKQSDYVRRTREVDIFNSENRWKKRGITVIPTMFGIAYTIPHMNQAGALVHIYHDGSVLLTHGGVEMGQGLHTKMIQVASRVLRIPETYIHISETATNLVPNTSPCAASTGSDLNGMAVMQACQTIMNRLDSIISEDPKGNWKSWVKKAYLDRISLSSTGFYRTPDIGYDFTTNSGKAFNYFTCGAACSEVEIDCLTGDHQVLRTDIVMDLGTSLNPAIDIGQVEGAFVQGYGMLMMEQQKFSPKGFPFTRGPGNYKIPGFGDIPVEFNVSLLKGSVNDRAVYSSKAVGEPPLFLSSSIFFAVKEAILSARADAGHEGNFCLNSPATPEHVRMSCEDQFTELFPPAADGSFTPWFVNL